MLVAKISDGVVVNVETCTDKWLRATREKSGEINGHPVSYVEFPEPQDGEPDYVHIGYEYDPVKGFQQPPKPALTPDGSDYVYDANGEMLWYAAEWVKK